MIVLCIQFQARPDIRHVQVHVQREAALISGLHKHVSTTARIDFGSVPRNVVVKRSFHLFNQSGFDVDVQLSVHVWEKQPGCRLVDTDLELQADGYVKVSARYCDRFNLHRRFHAKTRKYTRRVDKTWWLQSMPCVQGQNYHGRGVFQLFCTSTACTA